MMAKNKKVGSLVAYNPTTLMTIAESLVNGTTTLVLPKTGGPVELNAINVAAYTIINQGVMSLTPRELAFLGSMARANALTKKQRKWLVDLYTQHIGHELSLED